MKTKLCVSWCWGVAQALALLSLVAMTTPGVCGQPSLVTIAIDPQNPTNTVGQSRQFTATGTFSDNSSRGLTGGLGAWMTNAPLPSVSLGLGAAVLHGKLYAISGDVTARVAVYEPVSDTWSTNAPLPEVRFYFGTAVANGKIYVVGGAASDGTAKNTLYIYDSTNDSWAAGAPLPQGGRHSLGVASLNGKIYAVGGIGNGGGPLATLEAYDIATDTWTTKASVVNSRYNFGVGAIGGLFYVGGGTDNSGYSLATLEIYDPFTDTWTMGTPMATARSGPATVLDGKLYFAGAGPPPKNSVDVFDPISNVWYAETPMVVGRDDFGVAADELSRKLYTVGGYNSRYLSTLEVFTPPEITWQSSAPGVATINSNGLATAIAEGTAMISASAGSVSGTTALNVRLVSGPNVKLYMVSKGQSFMQSGSVSPVLASPAPFRFVSVVDESTAGAVSSANLQLPSGSTRTLTEDEEAYHFQFEQPFTNKTSLDSSFISGTYTFTIDTLTEGTRSPALTLPADAYPSTPHLSNWTATQAVDADADFHLTWDVFTGGTELDFIQVFIRDELEREVVETPGAGEPGALTATDTSITIPAGTLAPGSNYTGAVMFAKCSNPDTNAYPGAVGVTGFFKETRFNVSTLNAPPPQGRLQFGLEAYTVSETNVLASLTVTRTGGSIGEVSVQFSTAPGTATSGTDYAETSGPLTFAEGETSVTFSFPILDDVVAEGTETVLLSLSNPTGGAVLGSRSNAVLSMVDNEIAAAGMLQFSAATYTISEIGPSAKILVTRTGGSSGTVMVNLMSHDGTATAGEDYLGMATNLTFGPGVLSRTIDLPVTNDTLDETNETVLLKLSNPTGGASLGVRTNATATITDNDVAGKISFSTATYSVNETGVTAQVVVSRAGGTASGVTVEFATTDGTARSGPDYTALNRVLTFAANELNKTNLISISNDDLAEGNETINLALRNATGGAALGPVTNAVLTIVDDEVSLQFSKMIYTNSEAGPLATVTVKRSGPANKALSVNFATVGGGTAEVGTDYLATNGTLTFPAGTLSKTFGVRLVNDTLVEPDETVNLALSSPSNALLGPVSEGTLLITNNDFGGVISFSATNYTVTEAGSTVSIVVARTGGIASGVTVDFATGNDTASAGHDYTTLSSNLTFAAGELQKTLKIPIHNDGLDEENEKFKLLLSNSRGGASLGTRSNATVTVTDDDVGGTVQFSAAGYTVSENGTNSVILLTRSGGAASNVLVNFSTADDTANAGSDYSGVMTSVSFGARELSKTVLVPILQDADPDGNQTLHLRLREVTGGAKLGAVSNAVLTILDDESSFAFTNGVYNFSEAGPVATVNVIRSGFAGASATVNYTTGGGEAQAGSDYAATNGMLSFGPGVTIRTITVKIFNDTLDETNEAFGISLNNPTGGAQLGALATATVLITDNDTGGTIQFSAANYSAAEGTPAASVKVVRTGGLASGVTVHLESSDGSATSGVDYTALSTNLTFNAGELSKTVTVPILSDALVETNETVNLTLNNPSGGASIGATNIAILTIVNKP